MAKTKDEKNSSKAAPPPSTEGFSLISNEKLIALYASMAKCRMVESRAESFFQHGKLTSDFHVSAGREASAVAVVIDQRTEDTLSLSHEDRIPAIAKGASLENTFRSLAVTEDERNRGRIALEANDYRRLRIIPPTDSIAQIASLLESAQAAKEEKKGNIVTAFFTTDSKSRTNWNEAMTIAGTKGLPIIFVHHSHDEAMRDFGAADSMVNGIPAIVVDGGDAVAIYRVACEAIARARQGRGPTYVECAAPAAATALDVDCIKLGSKQAIVGDPILNMQTYLKQKGLWNEETATQIIADFGRELDIATRFLND
jgi:TPP-dependent pyruvate/acetoin dehydrogenase alpha subunit